MLLCLFSYLQGTVLNRSAVCMDAFAGFDSCNDETGLRVLSMMVGGPRFRLIVYRYAWLLHMRSLLQHSLQSLLQQQLQSLMVAYLAYFLM